MSSVQQQQQKNHKAYKRNNGPLKGKNQFKRPSEKNLMTDILDKDFETTALKMPKEIRKSKK